MSINTDITIEQEARRAACAELDLTMRIANIDAPSSSGVSVKSHHHGNTAYSNESIEDKTIRIVKGDLEDVFNIDFETLLKTYNNILDENPEKLI
mgnify:CR=1 FL=1|jgi:hypothetical protein